MELNKKDKKNAAQQVHPQQAIFNPRAFSFTGIAEGGLSLASVSPATQGQLAWIDIF